MENEFEQLDQKVQGVEGELLYWKEVLQKSEKYERLMADPDFLDMLEDVGQTVRAHEDEIRKCLDGMSEYSPKMLAEAQHTLFVHQLLMEQAQVAQRRPGKILELAKEARKKVPQLEEKLSKMKEETVNV